MSSQVMNAQELAQYIGIAESTVYKHVEYRKIPFTKVGSLLRFPKWLIDRWLAEKAVRPGQSLFDEFERLHRRYHLKEFLAASGLDPEKMTEEQLAVELQKAIEELKQSQDGDTG